MRASASKIADFRDCPRKFWFRYVAGIEVPQHPSAAKGEAIHKMLESWGLTGNLLLDGEYWPIAWAIVQRLKEDFGVSAPFQADQVESWIDLEVPGQLAVKGKIDLWIPPVKLVPEIWIESWRTVDEVEDYWWFDVIDYKTTSNFKWAKKEEVLYYDPQAILYSSYAMQKWPFIRFTHLYGKTTGTASTKVVQVKYTPSSLRPLLQKLYVEDISKLAYYYNVEDPMDVPFDTQSCSKYGGCPHQQRCVGLGVNPFCFQ